MFCLAGTSRLSDGDLKFRNISNQLDYLPKSDIGKDTQQNPAGCVPNGYREIFPNSSRANEEYSRGTRSHPPCSACSSAFFPLSKSHLIFAVLVIIITWLWLITSSARLLYLRKHSNNVFVRCSALWRFMFLTALFFFITLLPYVIWMILDFKTGSSAVKSPLWYSEPYGMTNITNNVKNANESTSREGSQNLYLSDHYLADSAYLHPIIGAISYCLLLIHFAITPSLYLVRLLGFRRIISAI